MKKPVREFDDLDMELIQALVQVLSTLLGIKKRIMVADREQMGELYFIHMTKKERAKEINDLDYIFGSCYPQDRVIYLNPRLCKRSYQTLIETIIHELLHCKHPEYSEDKIQTLERELTGRYDYLVKTDKRKKKDARDQAMRVCKVIDP